MTVGYYVHHHGSGHERRARAIAAHLADVTYLSSRPAPAGLPSHQRWVRLVNDDDDPAHTDLGDPTAGGTFHWAPHRRGGQTRFAQRMRQLATWVAQAAPDAVFVDTSVEVTLLLRLLGVRVIHVVQPGERHDAPHQRAFAVADAILAPWPGALYSPGWLTAYGPKTTYVGGVPGLTGVADRHGPEAEARKVLLLSGSGGVTDLFAAAPGDAVGTRDPGAWTWSTLGVDAWAPDPAVQLRASEVVVCHAGLGALADVASTGRPAVVVPQQRPHGEQFATGAVLARHGLATVISGPPGDWTALLDKVARSAPDWARWETAGSAARAAAVVDRVA